MTTSLRMTNFFGYQKRVAILPTLYPGEEIGGMELCY